VTLAGRRALVTGASRGIGAATARALAAAGASVAVSARTRAALDELVADLPPIGPRHTPHVAVAADLATAEGAAFLSERVRAWCGGAPDLIVNNAGAFAIARVDAQDPDDFARTLAVNLEAPFRVVHAFLAAMRDRGSGDIINVGSVADRQALAGNAAYGASKYGLRAVHEALRAETRGTGVRATLISPGPVDTDIWAPVEDQLGKKLPARSQMLRADDVARVIAFVVAQPAHVDVDELRLTHA
jgi:NADP-dependent 3-hydroxy acid dehydrogenase YdfG